MGTEYTVLKTSEEIEKARVSFKAGQDSVFNSMPENLPPLLEAAHKAGMMKVIEFINRVEQSDPSAMNYNFRQRWQAFLKSMKNGLEGKVNE